MQKKYTHSQAEGKIIDEQKQIQSLNSKKHSKAYYKLLHTYDTLNSPNKIQPISIYNCEVPIIAERLFDLHLNPKTQLSHQVQIFLKQKLARKSSQGQQIKNNQSYQPQQKKIIAQETQEVGFQIGSKDDLDEVVQIGMKYVGGFMKGLLPSFGLSKQNNNK